MITTRYCFGYVSATRKFAVFFSSKPLYAIRVPIIFTLLMQAIENNKIHSDDIKYYLKAKHNISLSKSDEILSAAERIGLIEVE